jgi:hypothetical protein
LHTTAALAVNLDKQVDRFPAFYGNPDRQEVP